MCTNEVFGEDKWEISNSYGEYITESGTINYSGIGKGDERRIEGGGGGSVPATHYPTHYPTHNPSTLTNDNF